jgi:CRP-like cAMP-binding protein
MPGTFLDDLDADTARTVLSAGSLRQYPPRTYLFLEGDRSTSVLVVRSGLVRIDRSTPSGRVALLDLARAGSLVGEFGVLDDQVRSAAASTVTTCRIASIPANEFRRLLRDVPAVQTAVMAKLTRRIRALSTQFVETSVMDAPSRVAARLVRLVEIEQSLGRCQVDPDGTIDLRMPINQAELGEWSGLSREGAVKGLTVLRSIGLIETGRKRVRILDLDALVTRAAPI